MLRKLHCFAGFAAVAALLLFASGARAQYVTPDSGTYWNPAASGSGFQIEFQDSTMSLTFFGYSASGQSTFYLLAGRFDVINRRYAGDLVAFSNGQCLGCPYNPPVAAVVGPASIQFLTRSTAIATLPVAGGRTAQIPIERFSFGYGTNLLQANVGVWATSVIPTNDYAFGDVIRIFTVVNSANGPVSAGNLYPFREIVGGTPVSLAGTSYNFLWLIDINATQNAGYLGEFTLEGFRGVSFVYPKGGAVPTTGVVAIATRIAGPDTANQILGAFGQSQPQAIDLAEGRSKAQASATVRIVDSDEAHIALTAAVRSLEGEISQPAFKAALARASQD